MAQVSSRYSDHFGCVCVVAFQIRFRYVSNLFHEWLKFRADTRIILVAYAAWLHSRFGFRYVSFSFMNGSSFEPILGSFWSRMLRGCVPDSVSLRFEVSSRYSDHFGRVCYVVAFQIRFRSFRIWFHEWLKFRAVLGSFWCCYACRKTGTGKPSSTSSLMCEAAACLNA